MKESARTPPCTSARCAAHAPSGQTPQSLFWRAFRTSVGHDSTLRSGAGCRLTSCFAGLCGIACSFVRPRRPGLYPQKHVLWGPFVAMLVYLYIGGTPLTIAVRRPATLRAAPARATVGARLGRPRIMPQVMLSGADARMSVPLVYRCHMHLVMRERSESSLGKRFQDWGFLCLSLGRSRVAVRVAWIPMPGVHLGCMCQGRPGAGKNTP